MAFQLCQHTARLYIGHRLMLFLPAIPSDSKKMIIHKACTSQCLIYYFLLLCIWIDSKFETLCILHFLTSFRNYVCRYILSYLQKTYNRTVRKIISIFVHHQLLTQIRWTRLISPCLKTGALRHPFIINFIIFHNRRLFMNLLLSFIKEMRPKQYT